MTHADPLLNARAKTHGVSYEENAKIAQTLKGYLYKTYNWGGLSATQQLSLEMICNKIARILAGDPNFPDHWEDIAGYAKLIADKTKEKYNQVDFIREPGCADDCTHPSHKHADCQNEKPAGIIKNPCHCNGHQHCMVDAGIAPKYVYCVKAEEADKIGSIDSRLGRRAE